MSGADWQEEGTRRVTGPSARYRPQTCSSTGSRAFDAAAAASTVIGTVQHRMETPARRLCDSLGLIAIEELDRGPWGRCRRRDRLESSG